jgi:UDP:flavonoid glycosyltransferase YjiC (YdhE family)
VRFLFTSQPGTGHLHPLLPVARRLRDAGHDIAFATSAPMAPEIMAGGFTHHAVGPPWRTTDLPTVFPGVAAIPPGPERYAWARRHIFAHATALDVVPGILHLAARWPPDVIVREAAEYGGYIAAEVLGIPHVLVRSDSGSASYRDRAHVADILDDVRARFGLPADPGGDAPFRHLVLSFAPPGLDDESLAPTCLQLRPAPPDCHATAPAWLRDIGAEAPVVYATLGTVFNSAELLGVIIDALADEHVEVVLTTAGRPLAGPFPPNVHVASWIPQHAVLPHAAAVITHGGYGTVSAALGHGVPMVLLPISADQPINAARLTAAGVGVSLGPHERSPQAIRGATRRVLADRSHRDAALRLAREGAARPGLAHALDLLERLGSQAR